jgi:hypothetical protein
MYAMMSISVLATSSHCGIAGGAFTTGQAAQRAPQKNTGLPLAGPDQARSLCLSPSRSTACRRDPRRRRTQHPSCYLAMFFVVEGVYIQQGRKRTCDVFCCGGGYIHQGRKRTSGHHPRGKPPPPNNRGHRNRCRSRRSRPRNLGRTGLRERGAQEDAVW